MRFTTDQQTLEDLNIFGRHGTDSIYTLFNRTFTRGGALILEEWFRYPLGDAELINKRSAIIQFFASSGRNFPFPTELFDTAEHYLENNDERTKLVAGDQKLGQKVTSLIGEDSQYKTIYRGVTALADILREMKNFLSTIDASSPYYSEKIIIESLMADISLHQLLQDIPKGKWPFSKIAAADAVLRFRNRELIRKILRSVQQLDVYISVARLANERGFAYAHALPGDGHQIRMEAVYHPQVRNAVPNTIEIDSNRSLVFLTGANMAGKSTFMKSVGVALFLAHMGLPVPAASVVFSVRDGIYTTINLPDDLGIGASHFYAEVLRVKKIAKELSQSNNLFVIFDELFRGTNVKDAYEATVALCQAFAERNNSLFIISTHIIEAGNMLKETGRNIKFLYLPTKMNHNEPVYTYTLENGITGDRHGMVIINNEGIIDILEKGLKNLINSGHNEVHR